MNKVFWPIAILIIFISNASGQNLSFNLLDSLNYNPTCLYVDDFNGDGLKDLFIGTAQGVYVVDPRTHQELWYGNILPETTTAIGYYDANLDGIKDILVGTHFNGYWLNFIYGPDFDSLFTWPGYLNAPLYRIVERALPDTSKIIFYTYRTYSLDINNWEYLIASMGKPMNDRMDTGNILSLSIDIVDNPPYPDHEFRGHLILSNSNLDAIDDEMIYDHDVYGSLHDLGIIYGKFQNLTQNHIISVIQLFEGLPMRRIIRCYSNNLARVWEYSEIDSTYDLFLGYPSWLLKADIDSVLYDDIMVMNWRFGGGNNPYGYYFDLYRTGNFGKEGRIVVWLNGLIRFPMFADVLEDYNYDELVFSIGQKIYIGKIQNSPTSIETAQLPDKINLDIQIYPNPFNSAAIINLTAEKAMTVNIDAIDLLGRKVDEIYCGPIIAGPNSWTWKKDGMASGTYFIIARGDNLMASKKVLYLK